MERKKQESKVISFQLVQNYENVSLEELRNLSTMYVHLASFSTSRDYPDCITSCLLNNSKAFHEILEDQKVRDSFSKFSLSEEN